ncbi:MAG: aspartate carbamoyltransferase catalytic subunit [Alphaproteobacteria bacterium]|nr:aspartate carbamoyltransferase catalytic subunit [Alphaproteobacteria bacterium]
MTQPFPHRHLLDIEQLSASDIEFILQRAARYVAQNRSAQRKCNRLAGKTVVNLFFEPSTRTRTSFELAARRLGADVVNVPIEHSSTKKGETLTDTARTIDAMQVDAFVIRHPTNGAPQQVVSSVKASVVNAGDGSRAHPTQALLDALTMQRRKGRLEGLTVAICGDIEHSRVARSDICLLRKMGAHPRIVAPGSFMPHDLAKLDVPAFDNLSEGIRDADVVMMLRIQNERLAAGENILPTDEYHKSFGLDHFKLKAAKPDVIVMHPAPMNRGVEITNELADDPQYSVVFEQIENGVATRMACLDLLLGG